MDSPPKWRNINYGKYYNMFGSKVWNSESRESWNLQYYFN